MGMSNSDNEKDIAEREARRQWYNKRPRSNRGYDEAPLSEDDQAQHDDAVDKWIRDMPRDTTWDNDRR